MTYTKSNPVALPPEVSKTSSSPSPEPTSKMHFVPRDLKFKPIALSEIKKVAVVLDFFSE